MLLVFCQPDGLSEVMKTNYITLIISSFMYMIVVMGVLVRRRVDIFEPFSLITILHLMIYLVAPIRSILINDTMHKAGAYTFSGCVSGTWIAFACYLFITLFYENSKKKYKESNANSFNRAQAQVFSAVIWMVGFAATIVYLAMRGMSLMYMITLGGSGDFNEELTGNSSFAFFSVIANIMFSSWLMRFYLNPKSLLTWVMFFLTMSSLVVRGFRIFIVILAVAPVIFYYLMKRTRPSKKVILIILVAGMVMIGFIGWARGALRTNVALDMAAFSTESIDYAFWGNFDIYKTYYGIMDSVPKETPYTLGSQMIGYTIKMFIPRALWPSKPEPPIREVLRFAVNDYAVRAGAAYPAIGEWYHEFGVIGCIVISCFVGWILKRLWSKKESYCLSDLLVFSTILPAILQLVIRGYTPTNFWMVLTMVLPIYFIKATCGDLKL